MYAAENLNAKVPNWAKIASQKLFGRLIEKVAHSVKNEYLAVKLSIKSRRLKIQLLTIEKACLELGFKSLKSPV